jgi:hypothetical protein
MTGKWRKSSYSTAQNDCVEVHSSLGALRDSKNPEGPRLDVRRAALARFVDAVKADRLG